MSRKETIKELLTFTKTEKKGVIVLFAVMIFLLFLNFSIKYLIPAEKYDFEHFDKEISEFTASLVPKKEDTYLTRLDKYIIARYDTIQLFNFDPNKVTPKQWKKLGLTDKQTKTILNYTSKGGKFSNKQDFRKMYGIRQKQYEILKPYIQLPEKSNYSQNYRKHYSSNSYKKDYKNEESNYSSDSLFTFNPNTATTDEWKLLGFSEKQIKIIKNFVNKGGKFYKKEDLKKIYGIRTSQYEKVKNYIQLSNSEKDDKNNYKVKVAKVDVNSLSITEFEELGKFWKYNAKQIVEYREKLGGFVNKEQLLEIWSVKRKYYDNIKDDFFVDLSKVRKIRLNFADDEELAIHPYLNRVNARDIIKHIAEKGQFKSIKELRTFVIVSRSTYKKIKPYLTLD